MLHVWIVVDKNDELLAFCADVEAAYAELEVNPEARELWHADCTIIDKELIACRNIVQDIKDEYAARQLRSTRNET